MPPTSTTIPTPAPASRRVAAGARDVSTATRSVAPAAKSSIVRTAPPSVSDQGEDGDREREQQDAAVAEAPGAAHLRCLAHEATLPSASSSPGASTRTSTSGASSATWRAKTRGGSTSALPRSASRPTGKKVPQWIGTAMCRAHDRHRLRRAQRVHVPGPERRPPAPDRQQGDVEPSGEAPHPVEELGVAREVHALRAGDLVAQRRDGRAQRAAAAVVDRGQRRDGGPADGDAIAGHDLVDLGEADAPQQPPGSQRALSRAPRPPRIAGTGRRDGRDARARRGWRRCPRSPSGPAARRGGADDPGACAAADRSAGARPRARGARWRDRPRSGARHRATRRPSFRRGGRRRITPRG